MIVLWSPSSTAVLWHDGKMKDGAGTVVDQYQGVSMSYQTYVKITASHKGLTWEEKSLFPFSARNGSITKGRSREKWKATDIIGV